MTEKRVFQFSLGGYAVIIADNPIDALKEVEHLYLQHGVVWSDGTAPTELCPNCYTMKGECKCNKTS